MNEMEVSEDTIKTLITNLQAQEIRMQELGKKVEAQTEEVRAIVRLGSAKTITEVRDVAKRLPLFASVGISLAVHKTPLRDAVVLDLLKNGSGKLFDIESRSGKRFIQPVLKKLKEMNVVQEDNKFYSLTEEGRIYAERLRTI
jgi:hypothetical protein